MTGEPRKTRSRIDGDGVKVVEVAGVRRGVWLLVLALLLAGAAGVLALRLALRERRARGRDRAASTPAVAAAPSAPPSAARRAPRRRAHRASGAGAAPPRACRRRRTPRCRPRSHPLPAFPDEPSDGPSGIALFPPLGTDPLKRGILVPEDFELPEGYVRHYQATDDGESCRRS